MNISLVRRFFFVVLILFLFYSRFVGLDWGLPYPMHPDERNITLAIQRLHCDVPSSIPNAISGPTSNTLPSGTFSLEWFKKCFNPEFFAYGQPTIYLSAILIKAWHALTDHWKSPISFEEATLALRFISALASITTVWVLYKILKFFEKNKKDTQEYFFYLLLFLGFSPYLIQFAHFGTTESVLMLLYSLIILFSLEILHDKELNKRDVLYLGFTLGLSIAVKISSGIFIVLPLFILLYKKNKLRKKLFSMCLLVFTAGLFAMFFSPQSFLNWKYFMGSMSYETDVGRGIYRAFYTRQFEYSLPYLFQMVKVFPYVLGWPQYILAVCGFILLPWKNAKVNVLRLAFLIFFIPTALLYAKWSRFIAPVFPVMTIFAALTMIHLSDRLKKVLPSRHIIPALLTLLVILPGIAYLRIYQTPDVRSVASDWIFKNIPDGSKILSETANVIDIPFGTVNTQPPYPNYSVISFDFYNIDENDQLKTDLTTYMQQSDYIFVPSRRIFANHACFAADGTKITFEAGYSTERCRKLEETYPTLNTHYDNLLTQKGGFMKVAEFTSFPRIELFGYKLLEFPDESAEETWTVFDHPVVRVYKSI